MVTEERRDKAYWRARVRQIGLEGTIREEMTRLGFWPPNPEVARQASAAMVELRVRYEELAQLRDELQRLEAEITGAQNVEAIIAEIRRRRIERVRAERAARRERRAADAAERKAQDQEWRRRTLPFLGRGVSGGLIYAGGDPALTAKLGLPPLDTAVDVAAAIGITEEELAWLTYHRGAAAVDHYHRFTIPKRTGGVRVLSAPKRRLRAAQRWVLERVLNPLPVEAAATAFRTGTSTLRNAEPHVGRAVVVRLDLKDFFPTVTFPRVKGLFRSFGYNEGVASLLALLTTEAPRVRVTLDGRVFHVALGDRQLPQGACTSPALTNLLCRKLDRRITGAAGAFGFAYTRYADDLTFSHARKDAPLGALFALVRSIVADEGFSVNEEKTAVMRIQHRQTVTGIVVNGDPPRLSREDLRRFRAFLHQCERDGFEAVSRSRDLNARAYAAGYLAYVHMVNPEQEQRLRRRYPWLGEASETV